MTATVLCLQSDLPIEWCAHCRGDDGATRGVVYADPPPRLPAPWVNVAPDMWTAPANTPLPASLPEPVTFPVLCARGEDCRPTRPDHNGSGGPRQTGRRAHLCPECEDHTRGDLAALAAIWDDLEDALTAPPVRDEDGLPGGREPSMGLALNEAASAAISDATATALLYARIARAENGWTPGLTRRHRGGRPYVDVTAPSLLRWLARTAVPFFAAHPDQGLAVAFADDAHRLWRAGRNAAYPAGWRTIRVPLDCDRRDDAGIDLAWFDSLTCQERAEYVASLPACPGRMTARVRPDLDRAPDLVCDYNPGHTVPPAVWQRLGWKANARSERGVRALFAHAAGGPADA